MKIALVIERMDPQRGGREKSVAQLAAELARRGHEVTIICQTCSWSAGDVNVRRCGSRGLLRVQRLGNFIRDAQRVIGELNCDIVHSTLPVPGANVYQPRGGTVPGQTAASYRRRSLPGKFAVAMTSRLNFCRRRTAELERAVVGDPNVLCLAVSHMIAEEFDFYYERRSGVRVVYNGVDVPDPAGEQRADQRQRLRYKLGLGQDDVVFLTVAKNFPLKGVTETIAAFARWYHSHSSRTKARLVVVGRDLVEGYQRIAGLRDVGAQVVFVPPTDDIFQWYAAADACVLLSWYDPCSRATLEALRWGIPSITTVYNGAAELLADGAGIIVASPKDTRAVAAAMDELADGARRAEHREACLRIADSLSMERHVDQLLEAFAEVCKQQ